MHLIQFITIIFVLLLASCTMQSRPTEPPIQPPKQIERPPETLPPSTRPTYNLSGYPAATKKGYIDGCETAKESPYGYKDDNRYTTDGQYRMGWDDGFDICRKKKQ